MAAIDLVMDVKKDSERLHQLVLGPLLLRTRLLELLIGPAATSGGSLAVSPEASTFDWEPNGGRFDLGLPLARGGKVWVELKVDGTLSTEQATKQLMPLREPGAAQDVVLFLLVGLGQHTRRERDVAAIARRLEIPDGRWFVRTSADVLEALADPALIARPAPGDVVEAKAGRSARDARDLAAAYRDLLLDLDARTTQFFDKPVERWGAGDYFGFFAYCRGHVPGMEDAGVDYVANPAGGFSGCWWGWTPARDGVKLYLQLENTRLCFKVEVPNEDARSRERDRALAALTARAASSTVRVARPDRLGHGQYMTIGHTSVPIGRDHLDTLVATITEAQAIVRDTAAALQQPSLGP